MAHSYLTFLSFRNRDFIFNKSPFHETETLFIISFKLYFVNGVGLQNSHHFPQKPPLSTLNTENYNKPKTCPSCGAPLNDDDIYCGSCGTKCN
ncbi:MAG: zinc-ribbon domain-containing protein [Candidatus Limousia pullorum]